jgi:archaellum component FlaC
VKKWERPLDKNFVPKLGKAEGKPLTGAKASSGRNFLKDNKADAITTENKMKGAGKPPIVLELGKMPSYLVNRLAAERFEVASVKEEKRVYKTEKKERRRFEKADRDALLQALQSRLAFCVNLIGRAEMKGDGKALKMLTKECKALEADIKRLETLRDMRNEIKVLKKEKREEKSARSRGDKATVQSSSSGRAGVAAGVSNIRRDSGNILL